MDEFIYADKTQHSMNVLDGLNKSRTEDQNVCDFTIKIDDKEFYCHRTVLSIFSPYFRAMFLGKFKESTTNLVELHDISYDRVQEILNFIYSGEIKINQTNVLELLRTADQLEFKNVSTICTKYLRHQIDESNVLSLRKFSAEYGYDELYETASDFIYDRLESVFNDNTTLSECTFDDLRDIVKNYHLHSQGEESLVLVILKWLEFNMEERSGHAGKLLPMIVWRRISVDFVLKTLLQQHFLEEHEDIKKLIVKQVKEATASLELSEQDLAENTSNADGSPRVPRRRLRSSHSRDGSVTLGQNDSPGECLLLIGGLTLGEAERGDISQPNVMCYNPRNRTWKQRSNWEERGLRGFSVTKFQNGVVVTGGCGYDSAGRYLNKRSWMYVVETDLWRRLPDMNRPRAFHGSCALSGEVYVLGGSKRDAMDLETFTLHSTNWALLKSSPPKFVTNFTLAPCNGKVLLMGCGSRSCSLTLQLFNPSTSQWSVFRSPHVPRTLSDPISAICRHRNLIALSGDNSKKMFIFNPNENSWERALDMQNLHANGGASAIGDEIFVTGGHWEGDSYWDEMEAYNITKKSWESHGPLPHLWLFHGCASVYIAE